MNKKTIDYCSNDLSEVYAGFSVEKIGKYQSSRGHQTIKISDDKQMDKLCKETLGKNEKYDARIPDQTARHSSPLSDRSMPCSKDATKIETDSYCFSFHDHSLWSKSAPTHPEVCSQVLGNKGRTLIGATTATTTTTTTTTTLFEDSEGVSSSSLESFFLPRTTGNSRNIQAPGHDQRNNFQNVRKRRRSKTSLLLEPVSLSVKSLPREIDLDAADEPSRLTTNGNGKDASDRLVIFSSPSRLA